MEKVAEVIVKAIEKVQRCFSRRMNKGFEGMSIGKSKLLVGLFALLFGGYSLFLVCGNLRKSSFDSQLLIEQIQSPKHLNKFGADTETYAAVDEETFQQIRVYQLFLDSLKKVNLSRYDSLLLVRSGLLDSINLLEEIYYSQQNSSYEK